MGDLSWLGSEYEDLGWFAVADAPPLPQTATPEEIAWDKAKKLLAESDWAMMPDVPLLDFQKQDWIEYRKALRNIRQHPEFPNMDWPKAPE